MHCFISLGHPTIELGLKTLVSTNFPGWEIDSWDGFKHDRRTIAESRLVILDIAIADAALKTSSIDPGAALIVMVDESDDLDTERCRQLGAVACIPSRSPLSAIVHSLRTASLQLRPTPAGRSMPPPLSPRQKDLVHLVLSGYSNKKIADSLGLSYGTVKNYMFDLMRVFGVNSRLELVVKIRERGLIV